MVSDMNRSGLLFVDDVVLEKVRKRGCELTFLSGWAGAKWNPRLQSKDNGSKCTYADIESCRATVFFLLLQTSLFSDNG